MSVESEDYLDRFETSGTDEFTITFPVQYDAGGNAKDIKVYYRNSAGLEYDITADCTIAGLVVTTPSAYAATTPASIVTLLRYPDLKQLSVYTSGSKFPASQFQTDIDRLTFLCQRLYSEIARSFRTPISDEDVELVIPNAIERASRYLTFDTDGKPQVSTGTNYPATPYIDTLLDDATAADAAATLEVYTQTEMKSLYQELSEDKRDLGEMFFIPGNLKTPVAFSWANRRNFFPAKCLDAINIYEDISATNWVSLVPWLRLQRLTYMEGKTGEKYAFDVTGWDITSNVATLTFANTAAENAVLAALAEDNLVHDSYTAWRTITLGSAIGDITAGDYAITNINASSRTISFAFTHANSSGSGSFTASFYHHRVAGSTTTARLFEASGRTLVSAGDTAGEEIAGLRRRDRMQRITGQVSGPYTGFNGASGAFTTSSSASNLPNSGGVVADKILSFNSANSPGARTGTTTDPRAQVGHLYIHGRDYAA